jgi:hypothetical protein
MHSFTNGRSGLSGGALPPVLPVVLYNGRRRWTAPVEVTNLLAAGSDVPAPYQPSQRYYVLDVVRAADADLPSGNLVSALIGLEKTRDAARLRGALKALFDLLRQQKDGALTRAFSDVAAPLSAACGPAAGRRGGPVGAVAGDADDAGRDRAGMDT